MSEASMKAIRHAGTLLRRVSLMAKVAKRSAPKTQRMPEALTMNPLLSVEDAATA